MKALALWLAVFVIFGVTAAAVAQSPTQPSTAPSTSAPADKQPSMAPSTPAPSASPKADVDVKTDSSRPARSPDVNVNIDKRDRAADSRQDDGAAFPRGAGGERTTIFVSRGLIDALPQFHRNSQALVRSRPAMLPCDDRLRVRRGARDHVVDLLRRAGQQKGGCGCHAAGGF